MKQEHIKEIDHLHTIIRNNIKRIRTQKKITQLSIGLAIGHASASFYAKAEIGIEDKKFSIDHLYKIAKVLDVDISELFQGVHTKCGEKATQWNTHLPEIDIIPWDDTFNIGIVEIDQQHCKLVQIINRLTAHFLLNASIDILVIFDELIAYTQYHFETEEKIWNHYFSNAPSEIIHKERHKDFIQTLKSLIQRKHDKSIEQVVENTLNFLIPWLLEHTLEADRYMAYLVFAIQEGKSYAEAIQIAQQKMQAMTDIIKGIYKILSKNSLQLMHQVTLQQKTERKLYIQEKFLRTLIRTIPDPIWVKDPQGTYIACNSRFVQLYGEKEEDIIGKNDYDFVPKCVADLFREQDQTIALTKQSLTLEEWNTFTDGHRELFEITKTALLDDANTLLGILGVARNITRYKLTEEKLQKAAYYDQLTELPNRVLFYERLQQAMLQTRQHSCLIAIIYVDLDGFKEINDTYGHEMGDQVLIAFAQRLKKLLKKEDTFARLGGDEFVIILQNLHDTSDVRLILERFLNAIANPFLLEQISLHISASWGVTFYPQKDEILDYEQLLRQSDQAMYHAKQLGKDQYQFYADETVKS